MGRICVLAAILFLTAAGPPQVKRPNIVLITIDTLRADRLGCYGYAAGRTPSIDRLASEGVLFSNAVSHVPLTRPSHASIFTGLYPFEHHIHDNISPPLDKKIPLLSEVLSKHGYRTAAFVASFVINSQSGFNRGFEEYFDRFDPEHQPTQFALNLEKRGDEVLSEFQSWVARKRSGPYFAWIHLYDPHFPYESPAPYRDRFAQQPYDGEVAYSDEVVGKILKLLDEKTLVILTSDHGESLGEHGENAHSYFIYDATVRVPLIVRWSGSLPAGLKIPGQVRLVDLFPTVLDLLSIQAPRTSGISLKPWLLNASKPGPQLYSYCETYTPWLHFGWSRLQGVRTTEWKYIEAPKAELFHLIQDPQELRNLFTEKPAKATDLKAWLTKSGALNESTDAASAQTLDPETLEKLASLGYAGITKPPVASSSLADPKDKINDFRLFNRLIREGIEDFGAKRFAQAAKKFQQLRDKNIPSFEVHYYLGRSLLRLKSYDKARTELEAAIQTLPHFLPAYDDLSETWEGLGNMKRAEDTLLAALAVAPNHPLPAHSLAWFYQRHKKYDQAEKILIAELTEHPEDWEARFRLGSIYRDTNRPELAMEQFQKIVAPNPKDAEAHNQLGMLLGGAGRLQEAVGQFAKAIELDPKNEAYRHNLDLAQQRMRAPVSSAKIRFRVIQVRTRAVANVLVRKLEAGEDWNALARDYSIHPSARSAQTILEMGPSEVDSELLQTLQTMKPGAISDIIETPDAGYFLLKREN